MTPKFDQLVNEKILNIAGSASKAKQRVHDEVKAAAEEASLGAQQEVDDAEKAKIAALEDIIAKGGAGMSGIDKLQLTLDVGGLGSLSPEPVGQVVGFASDATNTAISLARGLGAVARNDKDAKKRHFANMGLSMLGLVPWVGDAAAAGLKGARTAGQISKASKGAKNISKTGAFTSRAGRQLKTAMKGGDKASKAALAAKGTKLGTELGHVGVGVGRKVGGAKRGVELSRKVGTAVDKGIESGRAAKTARAAAGVGALGVKVTKAGRAERHLDDEDPTNVVPTNVVPMKQANATHQNVKRPPVSLAASWKPRKLNSSYSY